jgi:NADH dehydrogenase/NADH:ubiquinone oxidoreductase subunit G
VIINLNCSKIEVFEGETIFDVAHRLSIEIPALCYASGYKHHPSCMVCAVKDGKTGQIVPSCNTLVTEGMVIDSESDEVKKIRRLSLELLLSDHISVCRAPCKPKECKLSQYAITYRAKWNRYPRYSAIKETQPQHIKGNMWFDITKCIRCGLCVYNSNNGFTFKGRGFGMQVVLPVENGQNVNESLCSICPTCALYLCEK